MKESLVLFLDFDGVFHHFFPHRNKTDTENSLFYYADNVEDFCLKLNQSFDLKIVFATSWKEKFSFDDLKGFFEDYPAIYSSCYSVTPNIKGLPDEGYKWTESEVWLHDNQYNGLYIILDDNPESWKENGVINPNLIICNDKFDNDEITRAFQHLGLENQRKFKL